MDFVPVVLDERALALDFHRIFTILDLSELLLQIGVHLLKCFPLGLQNVALQLLMLQTQNLFLPFQVFYALIDAVSAVEVAESEGSLVLS